MSSTESDKAAIRNLAHSLVDEVRSTTDLPWRQSQTCVQDVVSSLLTSDLLQDNDDRIRFSRLHQMLGTDEVLDIDECSDMTNLVTLFAYITDMHADQQERSWSLHEDVSVVVECLEAISSVLQKADRRVSLRVLLQADSTETVSQDAHFEHVIDLYQMEQRTPVRIALLAVLRDACLLAPKICCHLMISSLPLSLAQTLLSLDSLIRQNPHDSLLLRHRELALDVFSLVFCTGEAMPFQHLDVINEHVVRCLLHCGSVAYPALLAFNLQFSNIDTNIVLSVLREESKGEGGELAHSLVSWSNRARELDPVWRFGKDDTPDDRQHSVLKLLRDMFSQQQTVDCFYTTDLDVLVDICTREIVDIEVNQAALRSEFLELVDLVRLHCNSSRLHDIQLVLQTLLESLADESVERNRVCQLESALSQQMS